LLIWQKKKKQRILTIEEHNLDHVEERVKSVEQTTKQMAEAEQRQNELIKELKLAKIAKTMHEREIIEKKINLIAELREALKKKKCRPQNEGCCNRRKIAER